MMFRMFRIYSNEGDSSFSPLLMEVHDKNFHISKQTFLQNLPQIGKETLGVLIKYLFFLRCG